MPEEEAATPGPGRPVLPRCSLRPLETEAETDCQWMPEAVQKRQGLQEPQVMKRCVNDKCEYTAHYDVQKYSGFC